MNNSTPVQDWKVDDVGRWLAEHQLRHLISRFESLGITGEHLLTMDDNVMKNDLRITNPGERAALNGALMNIRTELSRGFTVPERPRSTSFETNNRRGDSKNRLNTMPPKRTAKTMPTTHSQSPVITKKSAEIKIAPAPHLLDDSCRHSGWIRKMGGSYKSWKQRYLILRLGHLYYYENESSKGPKGHFPLHGYVAEATDEIKRFPWVFKLRHHDPKMRTYYIGVAAKRELDQWLTQLNSEIADLSTGFSNSVMTASQIQEIQTCESDDEEQSAVYDEVPNEAEDNDDEDTPYEKMTGDPADEGYYASVPQESPDEDEQEEEYERILEDQFPPPPRPQPSPILPRPITSPSHSPGPSSGPQTPSWSLYPHNVPRPGKGDAPFIPPRPSESLGSSLPRTLATAEPEVDPENPYLSILGDTSAGSATTGSTDSGYRHQYNNHSNDVHTSDREAAIEEENPYYITLGSVTEVMPDYCVFGAMSRDDAENRLARSRRLGTYLLRDGQHQGAVKVLSVWAGPKCRHYKLYKEDKGYCLTHGDGFPTIPMLLQHYKENEMLPKSDYNLGEPYHPLDH